MPAIDTFHGLTPGVVGPYTHAFAIAPADGTELPNAVRAIYVGGAGTIKLLARDDVNGTPVTLAGCLVGTIIPVWTRQVWATGTTATLLIGLY